jgi:GNAT superfamily N-acetyltransferase
MPLTDVTIRYLEMIAPGDLRVKRLPRSDVAFARVHPAMPELNRFFYAAIGGKWFWLDRRPWTFAQWAEWAERADLETWVLSVDGIPAGYCELLQHDNGEAEIKYFGLLSAFVGRGLGAHLLTEAVTRAWAKGASRVILDTCNLDHPRALENYLARGFREYRSEVKRKEVPLEAPGPWEGAVGP